MDFEEYAVPATDADEASKHIKPDLIDTANNTVAVAA
jgi:hypothetical protein